MRAAVAELDGELPDGVRIFVTGDDAVFIDGAIHEVLLTLGLAVAIVVAIIFLFLRDWRATLIPAVTHPGRADRHGGRALSGRASRSTS